MDAVRTSSQGRTTSALLTCEPFAGLSWGWECPFACVFIYPAHKSLMGVQILPLHAMPYPLG